MEECFYYGCKQERREEEFFCKEHKIKMEESNLIIMCDWCGRVIEAKKKFGGVEVKKVRCNDCKKMIGK